MLNNTLNPFNPWDSQNPYNPRLNKKQALWASFKKKENNNYQHYNILSAYEVKDETSTNSRVFSCYGYSKNVVTKMQFHNFATSRFPCELWAL
jgi:hypothetical protein